MATGYLCSEGWASCLHQRSPKSGARSWGMAGRCTPTGATGVAVVTGCPLGAYEVVMQLQEEVGVMPQ